MPFAWTTAEVLERCAGLASETADHARVIELSEERDQQERRLLAAEQAAYQAGYRAGRADQARQSDRAWAAMPALSVAIVPSHAELELARHAREHFGDPRPDDYKGGSR